jgi:hypothetical protein
VGDYYLGAGEVLKVRISDLGNADYEFLVLIHELIEAYLCAKHGISEAQITAFDTEHPELPEPGASPDAPYHQEHEIAGKIEMLLADYLGVDWVKYSDTIDTLTSAPQGPEPEAQENLFTGAGER